MSTTAVAESSRPEHPADANSHQEGIPVHIPSAASSSSSSSSSSISPPSRKPKKKTEFDDERQRPIYPWSGSIKDWFKQGLSPGFSDEQVESKLLSYLPFFPQSDGKRESRIIDTKLDNGTYIHEFYIENIEPKNTLPSVNQPSSAASATATENDGILSKLGIVQQPPPPPKAPEVTDIVLVHGYAASLGLFIDNFDSLSKVPGIKIHAIDLIGFGFSSRPKFPNFSNNTKQDIYKIEDWFIDAIEEWRIKRNINRFILIGHSFGGYLSCAYAMKYNRKLIDAADKSNKSYNLIDKLILVSPVGVERSKYSLLKNIAQDPNQVSQQERQSENESSPYVTVQQEVTADQESIVHGPKLGGNEASSISNSSAIPDAPTGQQHSSSASSQHQQPVNDTEEEELTRRRKFFYSLWRRHYSPFSIVRNLGPIKSKMISQWTTHRFAHVYYQNPQHFQNIHNYMYRIFNGAGSGEFAITRVLDVGALARLPLMDRVPAKFAQMNLPTLWLYGDKDWMNDEAGQEIVQEINHLADRQQSPSGNKFPLAQFNYINNAGHHLYLDNPPDFAKSIFKFLGFKK